MSVIDDTEHMLLVSTATIGAVIKSLEDGIKPNLNDLRIVVSESRRVLKQLKEIELTDLEAELALAYEHLVLAESFIPDESWEDYEEMYHK